MRFQVTISILIYDTGRQYVLPITMEQEAETEKEAIENVTKIVKRLEPTTKIVSSEAYVKR